MNVKEMLMSSEAKKTVWIQFLDYANRLFAAGRKDLWSNSGTFLSVYSQGQGLLRSDVLSVPVLDVYAEWITCDSNIKESWTGRRPAFVLKKLLAWEEPKNFLSEVLAGLQQLYRGNPPIVLTVPSPQKLLQWVETVAQINQEQARSSDDIEAASMYLAEYLRSFSTSGLSAIVLMESDSPLVEWNRALPLYQPIFNVVKHYQWSLGIQLAELVLESMEERDEVDFYLCPESDRVVLASLWQKGFPIGAGLTRDFWAGNSATPEFLAAGFAYGVVPSHAEPETVLAQLKKLRS